MARPRNVSEVHPTAGEVYSVVTDLLDLCVLLLTEGLRGTTTAGPSDRGAFWRIRDELLYAKRVIPTPEKAVIPESNMARVAARLRLDFEALCGFAAAEPASESRDCTLAEELLKACDREASKLAIEREHVVKAIEETRARNRQRLQDWERPGTDWLRGSDERGSILMTAGDLLGGVLFNASGERPSQSASRKQLLDIVAADAAELTRMVSERERLGLVLVTLGTPLAEIPWAGEEIRKSSLTPVLCSGMIG